MGVRTTRGAILVATAVGILFGGAAATHRRGDPRLLTDDGEDVYDPRSRIFIDGGSYDGDWVEGEMHGRGVYTYAHGDSYDGDWVEGKKHGRGVHTYAYAGSYDGDWVEGKKHGRGVRTYWDGDSYDGDWVEGKQHGRGVYTYALTGRSYDQDWVEGKQQVENLVFCAGIVCTVVFVFVYACSFVPASLSARIAGRTICVAASAWCASRCKVGWRSVISMDGLSTSDCASAHWLSHGLFRL